MTEPQTTPTPQNTQTAQPTNGLAVAALVTGIFGMGIIPIVLGILGLKKPGGRGMSIAGIVLGVISLIATAFFVLLMIIGLGAANREANKVKSTVDTYQNEQQEKINAQKDFSKGETARFGDLEIQASIKNNNYVPANEYSRATSGKRYVVIDVNIKNVGEDTETASSYSFKLSDNKGVLSTTAFVTAPGKALGSVSLTAGGSTSGELVFEVDKDASGLKLAMEDYAYNYQTYKSENITYTLAL